MKEQFGHKYEKLVVRPGYKAPDFTLKDEAGRDISLYGFLDGHLTVLVFFKGVDDRHTREQLDFLKDSYERIKFHNADVLAVSSGDVDFNTHLVDDMQLPFHILSDAGCEVMKRYEIFNVYDILEGPVLFIINSAGLINFLYDSKNPEDIVEEAEVISILHQLNEESDALVFGDQSVAGS